MCFLRNLRLE